VLITKVNMIRKKARRRVKGWQNPQEADETKFAFHLPELIKWIIETGNKPAPHAYARVSERGQWKALHHEDQLRTIRRACEDLGFPCAWQDAERASGKSVSEHERTALHDLFDVARNNEDGEIRFIVVESLDRLLHGESWKHIQNPFARATEDDWRRFNEAFQDPQRPVPIATIIPPNTPLKEIRAAQSNKRKKLIKRKNKRWNQEKERAREMRRGGMSLKSIAEKLGTDKSHVQSWLKNPC
jgi:Resolvase, N terminal domain